MKVDKAAIVKNRETNSTELCIETAGKWMLYDVSASNNIDLDQLIAQGQGSGTFVLNVPHTVRSYFQLVTENNNFVLSETHLPLKGSFNFRDLGGIRTTDGKYVKWGRIFRSDDLHHLTNEDIFYLESILLVSVVDFRSPEEVKRSPDKLPRTVKAYYEYSITPGNLLAAMNLAELKEEQMDTAMMHMYESLVVDTTSVNRYKDLFALLQSDGDVPLLFHCSAGKDRTGVAAALVLFALGVDENTIIDDYLLSNAFLGDKYASYIAQNPNLKPLFRVKIEFIGASIAKIKKDHGSVLNYLTEVLKVDIEKFRNKYLY